AHAILQNAVDARESIGIFEVTRHAPSTIGLVFAWVLMLFVCTPWIRPFRWSRLLWTYLVPIIPLVLLFDGVVSCLRTYRPQELREIVEKLTAAEYQWESGEHSRATAEAPITYLIGYPRADSRTHGRQGPPVCKSMGSMHDLSVRRPVMVCWRWSFGGGLLRRPAAGRVR